MTYIKKAALAACAFSCAALFSVDWSEQGIVSLAVGSAQARVGRPLTPVSVAGVARRQGRRAAYGYGAGVVGAGLGAAAIGTAAAANAASYYGGAGYYSGGPYASYPAPVQNDVAYPAPAPVQNAAPAFGTFCVPGTMVQMQDGQMHLCQ